MAHTHYDSDHGHDVATRDPGGFSAMMVALAVVVVLAVVALAVLWSQPWDDDSSAPIQSPGTEEQAPGGGEGDGSGGGTGGGSGEQPQDGGGEAPAQ